MRAPILLALLLALGVPAALAASPAPSKPADVLLAFAAAARGDNAGALADWRAGTDPCTWSGVACAKDGTVTALRLPRAGLRGQLLPDLSMLPSLQHMDLSGNALGGRLPTRWARLAELERLHLDRNRLTGTLPATWNMLDDLQYLSLSGNRLNGTLPVAWSSMGRQLYMLDLSGNSLSGPLPAAWSRQRMLLRLGLARNNLTGPLPREWGRLQSLLQLDLASNGLSGPVPAEWGALRETSALDVSSNALTGALPPSWSGLSSLQMLSLAGNQLSGAVPPQWVPLSDRAYRIALGGNAQMCGSVPPPLASAVLAAGSSARGSGLGQPCSWQADAAALLRFKAAVTTVPPAAATAAATPAAQQAQQGVAALADWQESSNPCTQGSWTGVSCRGGRVAFLNLANAGLRLLTLEPLSDLGALQRVLLTGNNAANATLPASWAALGQLEVADLAGTGIRGTLPPSWAALRSLKQLHLRGNALSGTLPASWEMLDNLAELDLSQNALIGSLPPKWSALGSLTTLDVSSNYLTGSMPDGWGQLDSLQELRLAFNNLRGPIPSAWAHMPSLTHLDLGSNVGVCGGQPAWRDGTQVETDATSLGQSCIVVGTSGAVAGVVLGLTLSVTLASLVAVAALTVYIRRQRVQLALLQRERSTYSFSGFPGGGSSSYAGKLASLHTFSATGAGAGMNANDPGAQHKTPGERVKTLTIPNPWAEEQGGYIQVPVATPGSALPSGARTPRASSVPAAADEHRSPSPVSGMPSPERHLWQVAVHAADRGVDLTARRSRQKRLFRSRSEAPSTLLAMGVEQQLEQEQQRQQQQECAGDSQQHQRDEMAGWASSQGEEVDVEMLRVHSRVALLPPDGGMV